MNQKWLILIVIFSGISIGNVDGRSIGKIVKSGIELKMIPATLSNGPADAGDDASSGSSDQNTQNPLPLAPSSDDDLLADILLKDTDKNQNPKNAPSNKQEA